MVDRFERFSFAISEISRYWHKITADEMEKYGLKGPHSVYLTTMYRYPEGVTAPQLCELCGKDKSDVSRAMSLMEQKGLVERQSVSCDARLKKIVLTEKSKAISHLMAEDMNLVDGILTDGFSAEEKEALYNYLERMKKNLKNYYLKEKEE